MLELLKDLLLVSLGGGIGVTLMCLLITGKQADKDMERMKGGEAVSPLHRHPQPQQHGGQILPCR